VNLQKKKRKREEDRAGGKKDCAKSDFLSMGKGEREKQFSPFFRKGGRTGQLNLLKNEGQRRKEASVNGFGLI